MDPFLALALAEGCDEQPVAALLDPAADPLDLLACPDALPPRVQRRLADPGLPTAVAALAAAAAAHGLRTLTPAVDDYPAALRRSPLRPLVLFARGPLAALHAGHAAVAVVGSRSPTPYGLGAAADFAAALARGGVVLWSGLARGVDAVVHQEALRLHTPTVAVLAGGLDQVYPAEHAVLAERILAAGGCLLSEAPPGRRPRRGHFPRRNRILAGATAATLVVEASLTSGALSTARFAADAGREVFAVPGPYHSERSQGCHRLIAEGAALAADPAELLRLLGLQPATPPAAALALQVSAEAAALLAMLQQGPRPADLVARECGLPRERFLQALFQLECAGAVRRLPGDLLVGIP